VVAAANKASSYAYASEQLQDLAEIQIDPKRCERIVQRLGRERIEQRQQRLKAYEASPLPERNAAPQDAPQGGWEQRVAAVMVDGGRAQLRDERWGRERAAGEKRPQWWREAKVALLATFCSKEQASDPLPEVPDCLLDPLWLVPKVNDIKAARGGESAAAEIPAEEPPCDGDKGGEAGDDRRHWSPPPLVRSVVATFEPHQKLGSLAKAEAHHRGFAGASRRAFVADGLQSNWTIWERHFRGYTPIVDLMHVLSYVYAAAQTAAGDMQECWTLCQAWIPWVWQGKVERVIAALDRLIETAADAAALEQLRESRGYLHNNRHRMDYAAYRRQGLPITTALMESTVKQINRRMKGTEKFWRDGAEPQLQLCADALSETEPMTSFWRNRAETQTGFRKSRSK
jgi:hypothetical protein